MIAMMTPSATPAILLFSRVQRHAAAQSQIKSPGVRIAAFVAGYLFTWFGFAVWLGLVVTAAVIIVLIVVLARRTRA